MQLYQVGVPMEGVAVDIAGPLPFTIGRTVFLPFWMPQELHSEHGKNFESTVFRECYKLLGIRKIRTTPMRPLSDKMVENFNWILGQELAKYSVE